MLWTGGAIFLVFAAYTPFDPRSLPQWPFSAYVALVPFLPGAFRRYVDAARSRLDRRVRTAIVGLGPVLAGLAYAGASVFLIDGGSYPGTY